MSLADQQFIRVKYGDDQEALFNPFCSANNLLEWMRKKCNCDEDVIIDLVDLDGQVKNLSGKQREYANEVVNGRETYVLIRVESDADTGPQKYTSLLDNLQEFNPDLMVKLTNMSRPITRGKKEKVATARKVTKTKSRNESPTKRQSTK